MKRVILIFGVVGVVIVAAALAFRLRAGSPVSAPTPLPDAGSIAKAPDAGGPADAGGSLVARVDLSSLSWNPRVKLLSKEEESFSTPGEAIGQLALKQRYQREDPSNPRCVRTLTLPSGIYQSDLPIMEVRDLRVVAEGGPVVFRGKGEQPALLSIVNSANITLEGVFLFDPVDPSNAPAVRPVFVMGSENITLSRIAASGASTCISMREVKGFRMSDSVIGPCERGMFIEASQDIRLEETRIVASSVALTAGDVTEVALLGSVLWSGAHFGTQYSDGPEVRLERSVLLMHPSQGGRWVSDGGVEEVEVDAPPSAEQLAGWARTGREQQRSYLASWAGASFRPEDGEPVEEPAPSEAEAETDGGGGSEEVPLDGGIAESARHVGLEVLPASLLPAWLPPWQQRARPPSEEEAREEPTLVGEGTYPVCGKVGPIVTYDAPDGEPTGIIHECSYYSDPASQPDKMAVSQSGKGWMQVGDGFIRTDQLYVVPMIRTDDLIIPLPLFKASVSLDESGTRLTVRGVEDPCEGESCSMEDGEEVTIEPDWKEVEIQLPRAVRKDELEVQESWSAECCT